MWNYMLNLFYARREKVRISSDELTKLAINRMAEIVKKLNSEKVVLYQERSQNESRPFLLAWQTEWMVGKLATLGHESTVSIDATFGTNKYEFQLVTMVCFDAFQNDIPCLWAIMERHEAVDLVTILTEVKKKVNAYRVDTLKSPDSWRPNCFLVDDAKEENITLR
ncbi:hypothetical protein R1sor_021439 [Riccia sorocarpa]|uniref:MULE transposase domain-containing protein n=1 Tax=Riccia sorocarpa TaxID=122646 RepID=A0ABD3GH44_9MARC